jgi:hypothetical protein
LIDHRFMADMFRVLIHCRISGLKMDAAMPRIHSVGIASEFYPQQQGLKPEQRTALSPHSVHWFTSGCPWGNRADFADPRREHPRLSPGFAKNLLNSPEEANPLLWFALQPLLRSRTPVDRQG